MPVTIRPLVEADVDAVVALSLEAWAPVFASFRAELGPDVYGMIYPDWRTEQANAVETVCRSSGHDVWVAALDGPAVGFVAVQYVSEGDARAGEIDMIAVDPAHQLAGVAAALLEHAVSEMRRNGIGLAVLGTGGDPGHAPARALYERFGFSPFPLFRYYRAL
jgi:GNAT superfamily N-acetyltransferase